MARFVFRLQKVLDNRIRIEDIKKQEYIKLRRKYIHEKEKLDILKQKLDEFIKKPSKNNEALYTYISSYNYITLLEERIKIQTEVIKKCERELEIKRLEFEESQKNRKVLEKLKQNAKNEYDTEIDKIEQKQNDEFALYGFIRNNK